MRGKGAGWVGGGIRRFEKVMMVMMAGLVERGYCHSADRPRGHREISHGLNHAHGFSMAV